jgi:hypothetical protein
MAAIRWGKGWRDEIDHKRREARMKNRAAAREESRQGKRDLDEKVMPSQETGQASTSTSADIVADTADLEKGTVEADTK